MPPIGLEPILEGSQELESANWANLEAVGLQGAALQEIVEIGITNSPDTRLGSHKRLGWEVLELRGPIDGHLIQQWETAILRMLKAKGADLSNEKIAGKFDGYSEAWSKSTFEVRSIKELMKLTEEFEEKK